jgi:hypothetical protein
MQTLSYPPKNKDSQATTRKAVSGECQVNEWSIYDAFENSGEREKDEATEAELVAHEAHHRSKTSDLVGSKEDNANEGNDEVFSVAEASDATSMMNSEMNDSVSIIAGGVPITTGKVAPQAVVIPKLSQMDQEHVLESFRIMENVVVENNYMNKLFQYRNIDQFPRKKDEPTTAESSEFSESDILASNLPALHMLFSFRCELTRGRSVLSMTWNKKDTVRRKAGFNIRIFLL